MTGCGEPPVPPEIQQAQTQQEELWRAGASVYAGTDYAVYRRSASACRDLLREEQGRWALLRDYTRVRTRYRQVLEHGAQLLSQCAAIKAAERRLAASRLDRLTQLHLLLRETADTLKDGRLAGQRLAIAAVELDEAGRLIANDRWRDAGPVLDKAEAQLVEKIRRLRPLLGRYADPEQLRSWQDQAQTAIGNSRTGHGQAIVISKLEKQLTVYRNGAEVARFPVTFGYNYLSRKLHAGDRATPEGRYLVQAKNPGSRYFKALLLDYPSAEDRRRFSHAQKSGQLPKGSGIGSLIEIHGGGLAGLTNGCIALENQAMGALFDRVDAGTPVVIVGSLVKDNLLSRVLTVLP